MQFHNPKEKRHSLKNKKDNATVPHPAYFNRSPNQIQRYLDFLQRLAGEKIMIKGSKNVLRYRAIKVGKDGKVKSGIGNYNAKTPPLMIKELTLHTAERTEFPDSLRYLSGLPFSTSTTGPIIGIFGDIYSGDFPLTASEYVDIGLPLLKDPQGKNRTIQGVSTPSQRKFYYPGNISLVAIHEIKKDSMNNKNERVIELTGRKKLCFDLSTLEKIFEKFSPKKLQSVQKETLSATKKQYKKTEKIVSEKEYLRKYFPVNYRMTLAKTLEQMGLATILPGAAVAYGGTGSVYFGHLMSPGEKRKKGEIITRKVNGVKTLHKGTPIFAGRRKLFKSRACGIFIDEHHQPHSCIPIGGSGLNDFERSKRDQELFSEGAVFSEICIATPRIASKKELDKIRPEQRMIEETHPLAKTNPDAQGLYVPVTILLDDTRRLSDVLFDPINMLCMLVDQDADENWDLILDIVSLFEQVTENKKVYSNEKKLTQTANVLLKLREQYLESLFYNIGRNLRAITHCGYTVHPNALTIQNLSYRGGIADTGDLLLAENQVADIHSRQALDITLQKLEGKPDYYSVNLFSKWLDDISLTAYALGIPVGDLIDSHFSEKLLKGYLGKDSEKCLLEDCLGIMKLNLEDFLFKFRKKSFESYKEKDLTSLERAKLLFDGLTIVSKKLSEAIPEDEVCLYRSGMLQLAIQYRTELEQEDR